MSIAQRVPEVSAPRSAKARACVQELLTGSGIAKRVEDTKAAREVAALEEFFVMLANDASRAYYGPGHVAAAAEQGAVATLLISDSLYRCATHRALRRWSAGRRAHWLLTSAACEASGCARRSQTRSWPSASVFRNVWRTHHWAPVTAPRCASTLIAGARRVHDAALRKRWVALVEGVEAAGGRVFIFSARHESGKQLSDLSGVAAVLRFSMPELEDEDPAELMRRLQLC